VKLADWARGQDIRYKTAYDWFRKGILPVPSRQMPTGTILVYPEEVTERGTALYACASTTDRKSYLDRQLARLSLYTAEQGFRVAKVIGEIGAGLSGHRPRLLSLLRDPKIGAVIVEHRDRLACLGSEYIEADLAASGRRPVVMDPEETRDDLVRDMLERALSAIEAKP